MQENKLQERRRRSTVSSGLAAAAIAVPLAVLGPAAPAGAVMTPPQTGCPAGQSLSVAWLATQGPYHAPSQIDSAGNNDGYVCGQPLSAAAAENFCGGPCAVPIVYRFRDNDLTPNY